MTIFGYLGSETPQSSGTQIYLYPTIQALEYFAINYGYIWLAFFLVSYSDIDKSGIQMLRKFLQYEIHLRIFTQDYKIYKLHILWGNFD